MTFRDGWNFAGKLAEAVGLDPKKTPIKRIVIDCACDSIVMVYVQMYLDGGDKLLGALQELRADDCVKVQVVESLDVDDKGNVRHSP